MIYAPSLTPTKQVQVPAGEVNSRVKFKIEHIKMGMMQKIMSKSELKPVKGNYIRMGQCAALWWSYKTLLAVL